jgi:hypothetical protein
MIAAPRSAIVAAHRNRYRGKENAMSRRTWIQCLSFGLLCAATFAVGCSNKGKYEGKVKVEVSQRLQERGVSLADWRYSETDKSFGIKLKSSKPIDKQTYLVISGPGIGQVSSPLPFGDAINEGKWIDFGGSKAFGNPFDNFPESGTITIDAKR